MQDNARSFIRRLVAVACSLTLAAALVPAVPLVAVAADETVLTVKIRDAETEAELTPKGSEYTAAQLQTMAEKNTTTLNFLTGMKGGRVDTTSSYVTLEQLVGSFTKWTSGAQLEVVASDGLTVTPKYEDLTSDAYYFPNYTKTGKSAEGKVVVPPVLALAEATTEIGDGTASEAATANANKEQTDAERQWLYGIADASAALPGGKAYPSKVSTITVIYPHKDFTILAKDTRTGKTDELKTYTKSELADLAKGNTAVQSYLLQTKSLGVFTTNSYFKLNDVLGACSQWGAGASVTATAPDGFSTTMSYADVNAAQYFYPGISMKDDEAGTVEKSATGAVQVAPIIALSYVNNNLAKGGTTEDVAKKNEEGIASAKEEVRIFRGATTLDTIPAGNTSVSNVESLTITYTSKAPNPMTVKAASKTVKVKKLKKKAQTVSALTVKKAQGAVSYAKAKGSSAKLSVNKKTGKITVKKKTKKGTYKIKVTVKAAGNASYEAKTQDVTVKIKVK